MVNPAGRYTTTGGQEVSFDGPRDLANYLAASEDSQRAFVESAFEYFVKQPVAAFGTDTIDQLTEDFRNNGFHIQKLLVAIAVTAAKNPTSNSST
jgi:hypothetical protein